jgi:hypothetical protein
VPILGPYLMVDTEPEAVCRGVPVRNILTVHQQCCRASWGIARIPRCPPD